MKNGSITEIQSVAHMPSSPLQSSQSRLLGYHLMLLHICAGCVKEDSGHSHSQEARDERYIDRYRLLVDSDLAFPAGVRQIDGWI